MNRIFTFFCGLPGSGKSTFIKNTVPYNKYKSILECIWTEYEDIEQLRLHSENVIVSADDWKKQQPTYNSEHPENIHEESVVWAENMVLELIKKTNCNILMDGGGINRSYNRNIINEIRNFDKNIKVKCIFFDTPIDVCLSRIESRERKVPIENIYEKNQRLTECVQWYQENCDEFQRINYFTNKYAFVDMDGTICAYAKGKRDIDGNVDFVNGKHFLNLRPVKHIINYLREKYAANLQNLYILTAAPNSVAWSEKQQWLKKYMPWIKPENYLFVGNKEYKDVFLKHWMIGHKIDKKDVMIIDDNHETLNKMIKLGVNALHPSDISCLDDEFTIFG